jgi:uncharacterized Zn finger protein
MQIHAMGQNSQLQRSLRRCPICSVTMQATETPERIIEHCQNCGMVITIVLPVIQQVRPGRSDDLIRT